LIQQRSIFHPDEENFMPRQTYDVIFSGKLMEGVSPEKAKLQISNIFKTDNSQLNQLFSGKAVTIKSDVDEETAAKYRVAFREAGALIEIKPSASPSNSSGKTSPSQPSTEKTSDELTLLPPNTGSLIDCAKKVTPQPIPDISNISLASPGTVLDETSPPKPPEIDTSSLSADPPNSGTLEDCKKQVEPFPIPDISHLDIDDR
jgi:hypothetical protein